MYLSRVSITAAATALLQILSVSAAPERCYLPDYGSQKAFEVSGFIAAQRERFIGATYEIESILNKTNAGDVAKYILDDMNVCMQLPFYEAAKLLTDQSFSEAESAEVVGAFKTYELNLYLFTEAFTFKGGDALIRSNETYFSRYLSRVGSLKGNAAKYFGKLKGILHPEYVDALGTTIGATNVDFDMLLDYIEDIESESMKVEVTELR